MNYLFDPARVVIKVRINKLYFVPEWLVFVVVIMLWNGGSLDMSRMSRSCSLILSCMGLSVSPTIFFHQYQALFTRHRLVSMLDCFICCFSSKKLDVFIFNSFSQSCCKPLLLVSFDQFEQKSSIVCRIVRGDGAQSKLKHSWQSDIV